MKKSVNHLSIINVNDEYGTPLEKFRSAIWNFDILPQIDVCSNSVNRRCEKYFSKNDDALTKEWNQDFFMNPPYSKVKIFMKYAYEQHIKHNVDALILVYAKTDTVWWHDYVENRGEVHFIKGRIKFLDENHNPTKHPAPYGSVWIIYRKKPTLI